MSEKEQFPEQSDLLLIAQACRTGQELPQRDERIRDGCAEIHRAQLDAVGDRTDDRIGIDDDIAVDTQLAP